MARSFNGAALQYLRLSAALAANSLISIACWFNSNDIVTEQTMVSIADYTVPGQNLWALQLRGHVGGDPVAAYAAAATGGAAVTSTGYSANTWHHGCAVFSATNARTAYIDGGSKGVNAVNVDPVGPTTHFLIGARAYNNGATVDNAVTGAIAEVGIWNGVLTDADVLMLAAGYRPLLVRPEILIFYTPLVRDQDYDLFGGYGTMTAVSGPTVTGHVPVIYGAQSIPLGDQGGAPPAAGVGLSSLSGLTGLSAIMG